jgi:signal transduction histidine kinase
VDFSLVFRGAPARLLVLGPGPEYRVEEASDGWLRARRLSRQAVVGRPVLSLAGTVAQADALRGSLDHVIAARVPDEFNAPVFDPQGRLICIVHSDGTPQAALLASEGERDRAMRDLQAAKEGLEAFAYSASHDLRAPLRAIGGYCALLRNLEPGTLPPIANDLLVRMDASVRNMAGIIDGLLLLTRADTSRLSRKRVDLSALATRIVRDLRHRDPDRVVEVAIADGLEALADETLVAIALENLIGNAWKYTAYTPAARIEVGRRKVVVRDVFFVSDNGPGFEMARAGKLFTPFFRMHSASEFEGHGIGLATVRRVVERHGGEIWAESQPGRGTTLSFTLG